MCFYKRETHTWVNTYPLRHILAKWAEFFNLWQAKWIKKVGERAEVSFAFLVASGLKWNGWYQRLSPILSTSNRKEDIFGAWKAHQRSSAKNVFNILSPQLMNFPSSDEYAHRDALMVCWENPLIHSNNHWKIYSFYNLCKLEHMQ